MLLKNGLKTIEHLLYNGNIALYNKISEEGVWQITPLYNTLDCSVGVASLKSKKQEAFQEHNHPLSHEYLIVTKGKLVEHMGGISRLVGVGECVSIPIGIAHRSEPLTDDVELIYICVPRDNKIPSVTALTKSIAR